MKTGKVFEKNAVLSPILLKLYNKYITEEPLGFFETSKQVICTLKYSDYLSLLAKKETVLRDMTDRLIEVGSCCGMEMNVEKTKVKRL
jgi:hypothetical protein